MFGTYRTFLALCVAATHLFSAPAIGNFAVHGFFILSGYLMTYIMSNTYGYKYSGVVSFTKNRFLRLYPTYFFIFAVSITLVYFWPTEILSYRHFIYMPSTFNEWAQNLSLIYFNIFPQTEFPRVSPPTWALTNELFYYLLIACGISKNLKRTSTWLVLSVIYFVMTHALALDHTYRYHMIIAASLPFSIGALIYHLKDKLIEITDQFSDNMVFFFIAAFFLNAILYAVCLKVTNHSAFSYAFYYLNYVINALIIITLINNKLPFINAKLDKAIGNYSYPVYLIHWQAGFISSMLLFDKPLRGMSIEGLVSFLFALLISVAISYIAIKYVEQPIEKIRTKLRYRANKKKQQQNISSNAVNFSEKKVID